MLTDGDDYDAMGLSRRLRLGGQPLGDADRHLVEEGVEAVLRQLTLDAIAALPASLAHCPWAAPDAAAVDGRSLRDWIDSRPRIQRLPNRIESAVDAAVDFEFENHMTVPTRRQSLLANFSAIVGGGGFDYWDKTEVFRCAEGNAALATALRHWLREGSRAPAPAEVRTGLEVTHLRRVRREIEVRARLVDASGPEVVSLHEFVVLTAPPTVWGDISVDGVTSWFPRPHVQMGRAVKYFGQVRNRYWVADRMAPAGFDDQLGQIWEGTDNQTGTDGIDVSVFAGGRVAARRRADYAHGIEALLPGFERAASGLADGFANWPAERFIRTGYSCPAPTEVVGQVQQMQQPVHDLIYLAGEHCSPDFFGYMEGALQSGLDAAVRILTRAGYQVPRPGHATRRRGTRR